MQPHFVLSHNVCRVYFSLRFIDTFLRYKKAKIDAKLPPQPTLVFFKSADEFDNVLSFVTQTAKDLDCDFRYAVCQKKFIVRFVYFEMLSWKIYRNDIHVFSGH
jgi:hypothetical protein